jgi:hypothetical protein
MRVLDLDFVVATTLATGFPLGAAVDLAVDGPGGHLYWPQTNGSTIRRSNLDGTNIVDVIPDSFSPEGVALDTAAGKLYWTENRSVFRANLDGSSPQELFVSQRSLDRIEADPVADKLYFVERGPQGARLLASDMNANDAVEFAAADQILGLDLDETSGTLMWTTLTGTSAAIHCANLRATGQCVSSRIDVEGIVESVAADYDAGKVYWIDPNSSVLRRANLDGSNVQIVRTATASEYLGGLAIDRSDDGRQTIAYTGFTEPPLGASFFQWNNGGPEMGFGTAIEGSSGDSPLVGTQESGTTFESPLFAHRSGRYTTAFEDVFLGNWDDVTVGVSVQVRPTEYEAGDFLHIYVTNFEETIDLFRGDGAAGADPLDERAGGPFFMATATIPEHWAVARLVMASSTNSSAGAERFDIDNVRFEGVAIVPEPSAIWLAAIGCAGFVARRRLLGTVADRASEPGRRCMEYSAVLGGESGGVSVTHRCA